MIVIFILMKMKLELAFLVMYFYSSFGMPSSRFMLLKAKRSAINVNGHRAMKRALWDKNRLTYSLHGQVGSKDQTKRDVVLKVLDEAFREWENISCFKFDLAASPQNSDIKIVFANDRVLFENNRESVSNHLGSCERRFRNSAAHAFFRTNKKFPAQIHVNNEIFWIESTRMPGSISLKTVLLHEIGHVLGLVHSNNLDSVMYEFIYTNKVKKVTVTDKNNLEKVYKLTC